MGGEGAISGLFWQQRMPVQQGYLHPYTNLTRPRQIWVLIYRKQKQNRQEKERTDTLAAASKDDPGGGWRGELQKSK
jgi:hypothetical protein